MDSVEELSDLGLEYLIHSPKRTDFFVTKNIVPSMFLLLQAFCSTNTNPLGLVGSRNINHSMQKGIKTNPLGLDDETVTTFGKLLHSDVQMEKSIWAKLPEDIC